MADALHPPPSARVEQEIDRYRDIPHVEAAPPGTSMFWRRIRLVNIDSTITVGELEDDCHHFRGPWTTCGKAGEPLRAIEGHPLRPRASAIGAYADARANCTHLFDLTGL